MGLPSHLFWLWFIDGKVIYVNLVLRQTDALFAQPLISALLRDRGRSAINYASITGPSAPTTSRLYKSNWSGQLASCSVYTEMIDAGSGVEGGGNGYNPTQPDWVDTYTPLTETGSAVELVSNVLVQTAFPVDTVISCRLSGQGMRCQKEAPCNSRHHA